MDGAELRLQHGAYGGIVKADHSQILRHPQAQPSGCFENARRQFIVEREDCGGSIRPVQQAQRGVGGTLDIPVAYHDA